MACSAKWYDRRAMTFHRKLIAVLAVLCLFGAQQAAFAHWSAHLGAPAVVGVESTDG